MAITTAMCTSFKKESWNDLHHLGDTAASPIGGDVFKLALIYLQASPLGTYGAATTNYSSISGEEATDTSSPQGYTAGGGTLTNIGVTTSGTTAYADFADLTFTAVTLNCDGCIIYNSTNGNRAVSVHDFSGTKSPSNGDLTLQFPAATSSTAILRLA
jgi:hypothetical protein